MYAYSLSVIGPFLLVSVLIHYLKLLISFYMNGIVTTEVAQIGLIDNVVITRLIKLDDISF